MKPSRATQPYRKGGPRQSGLALKAMRKGRTGTGFNPMDVQRAIAKGGNAPRKMATPVGPAKGVSRPAAPKPKVGLGALARKLNRTGNERDGASYREVAGISKSGVKGTYHVYAGGKRVFVADEGAKKVQKARGSLASRAKGAGVG